MLMAMEHVADEGKEMHVSKIDRSTSVTCFLAHCAVEADSAAGASLSVCVFFSLDGNAVSLRFPVRFRQY